MSGNRWQLLAGAAGILGLVLAPTFLDSFWVFFLAEILLFILFAQSFNLLFGYTGLLSLGQSVYFTVGAYTVALLIRQWKPGVGLLLPAGVLTGMVSAALVGSLAVRVRGHGFIIITAVPTVVLVLLGQDQSAWTGGDNGLNIIPPKLLGQYSFFDPTVSYYAVLPCFLATMFFLRWLLATPLGQAFLLVRENEARAAVLGYDTLRLKFVAFVIAGGIAGLAGALDALVTAYVIPSSASWTVAADAIIWTLVGGAGTLLGPVVGTGVLLFAREFLSDIWAHGYPLLLGLVLIGVVLFAPQGVVGALRKRMGG